MAGAVKALLDTNILIALMEESETTPDLAGFDALQVSSLSYTELTMGMHLYDDLAGYRARAIRFEALQRRFGDGIPYDDLCDDLYDEALLRVGQRGGSIRADRFDRMIAATAMAHDLVLVTRNVADFAVFEGMLEVVER